MQIAIFDPSHYAVPAMTCQAFVNGAVGVCLPSANKWVAVYQADEETALIMMLTQNPVLVCKNLLLKMNANYTRPSKKIT